MSRAARHSLRPVALAVCLLGLSGALTQLGAEPPDEPQGYRAEPYAGATPATLNGAPALSTAQAKTLWTEQQAIFVDVLPHVPRPAGLPPGTVWQEKPHRSIAGAAWLPEVGRAALAPETDAYLIRNLAALTEGHKERPLVIFCKRDCWMSWNAAKRAEADGYGQVFWYADGVEGWTEAGLPMGVVEPRP